MERGYSLGGRGVPNKPHVVYSEEGERLGVYHVKDTGTYPKAIVRKDVAVPVVHNPDRNRKGTFVASDPEPFRRFK